MISCPGAEVGVGYGDVVVTLIEGFLDLFKISSIALSAKWRVAANPWTVVWTSKSGRSLLTVRDGLTDILGDRKSCARKQT